MSQGRRSGDVGESLSLQASSPREAETLEAAVAGLAALDTHQLRLQWRNHLGGAAPPHLPRWLLLRVLAHRLQAAALGNLDKASLRTIRAPQGGAIDFAARPFNSRKPMTRDGIALNSGALLVREWRGKLERVMVLDKGFAWNGKTFGSLSQVAKAITGASWNGHRFFGLRSAKDQDSKRKGKRSSGDDHRQPEFDRSKDLGRAKSMDNRWGEYKGVRGGQTERPLAEGRHPGARLTGCRVSIPEPKPPLPLEGEPRQNIAEVCP
jgi:Protein of unknown function (DUF2924)